MDRSNANDETPALPPLLALAREAGAAIMAVYCRHVAVQQKADASPLAEADLVAHAILTRGLSALTPHIPVVSEEDTASHAFRRAGGRFWLIDPLDGTKEFIARNGEFTVNIALIRDGFPELGVVYAPALDLLYWSEPERGAYRKDATRVAPIRVAGPYKLVRRAWWPAKTISTSARAPSSMRWVRTSWCKRAAR